MVFGPHWKLAHLIPTHNRRPNVFAYEPTNGRRGLAPVRHGAQQVQDHGLVFLR